MTKMERFIYSSNKKMNTKFSFPFLLAVAIAYLVLGCAVIYFQTYFNLDATVVKAFGGLCIVYGLFRLFRAYNVYQNN
jgi:putative effector of murein hydrolase